MSSSYHVEVESLVCTFLVLVFVGAGRELGIAKMSSPALLLSLAFSVYGPSPPFSQTNTHTLTHRRKLLQVGEQVGTASYSYSGLNK